MTPAYHPDAVYSRIHTLFIPWRGRFQRPQEAQKLTPADLRALKTAKKEGGLHEALLDRREKVKADRYCK
jgi:protein FRG1